jgi:hypothetical protein
MYHSKREGTGKDKLPNRTDRENGATEWKQGAGAVAGRNGTQPVGTSI